MLRCVPHTLGLNAQNYLAEAFYFAEKSKGATLLEAVKDAEARSFSHIPTELLERENEMKQKTHLLGKRASSGLG